MYQKNYNKKSKKKKYQHLNYDIRDFFPELNLTNYKKGVII